jgi:hypothetical protein
MLLDQRGETVTSALIGGVKPVVDSRHTVDKQYFNLTNKQYQFKITFKLMANVLFGCCLLQFISQ